MFNKIGKYEVKGLIAQGASSKVYLAQDPKLSIEVAIKVFNTPPQNTDVQNTDVQNADVQNAEMQNTVVENAVFKKETTQNSQTFDATLVIDEKSPTQQIKKALSDFVSESKILHQLSSAPHIVSFMEFDVMETNQAYIVMPYYKRCLADLLGVDNKLSVSKTLSIALQILSGLSFIHEVGLVHLDIKPANILMDDKDQIQITDFGISVFKSESGGQDNINKQAFGVGSANFASPEQLTGLDKVSVQSDLYSVSALIYRCLTGNHFKQSSPSIEENLSIHPELSAALKLGLSADPALRPTSAKVFASMLLQVQKKIEAQRDHVSIEADPDATRVWESQNKDHDIVSQLNEEIQSLLLIEGEVNDSHFSRLALLAKAELHERYSDEWLRQYIEQTQSSLARQNNKSAALFLWVEQINNEIDALDSAHSNELNLQAKQRLRSLGVSTLELAECEIDSILDRKWPAIKAENISSGSKKKTLRRSTVIITLAILTSVFALLVNYWFSLDNDNNLNLVAPKLAEPDSPSTQQAKPLVDDVPVEPLYKVADKVVQTDSLLPINLDKAPQSELTGNSYTIASMDQAAPEDIVVEFKLLPAFPAESADPADKDSAIALQPKKRIRMMSIEVTNRLYMACVDAGKCTKAKKLTTDPRYHTFSLPQHPVINVSWYDITEKFIPWLAEQTGSNLRLPTKQEWEFAASASEKENDLRFSWGARMQVGKAHCKNCNTGFAINTTQAVASYPANKWQLFDMHGNVQEWTSTCPVSTSLTGDSRLEPRCDLAIVKGGSWLSMASEMSISMDDFLKKTVRSHTTGFRLVEDVND